MSTQVLAPIALFVFKRPQHTRRVLESLARNPEFARSPLHIFADGARRPDDAPIVEETRRLVADWPHPDKTIHLAPANRGLAASIIEGVGMLCASMGRVIVVEDDLRLAPGFLAYMNQALTVYQDEPSVMQVSGHMYPVRPSLQGSTVLMPLATSWGWATWQRAWQRFDPDMTQFDRLRADKALRRKFDLDNAYPYFQMLVRQRRGKLDSWAIRWYLSVFMADGLALFPAHSLVSNEGFDGSGTHCGVDDRMGGVATESPVEVIRISPPKTDAAAWRAVGDLLRSQRGVARRVHDAAMRWVL